MLLANPSPAAVDAVRVDKTDAHDLQLFLVDPRNDLRQPLLAFGQILASEGDEVGTAERMLGSGRNVRVTGVGRHIRHLRGWRRVMHVQSIEICSTKSRAISPSVSLIGWAGKELRDMVTEVFIRSIPAARSCGPERPDSALTAAAAHSPTMVRSRAATSGSVSATAAHSAIPGRSPAYLSPTPPRGRSAIRARSRAPAAFNCEASARCWSTPRAGRLRVVSLRCTAAPAT